MLKIYVHWAAKEKERISRLSISGEVMIVASCSPRAISALLEYAGVEFSSSSINWFINYREVPEADVLTQLKEMIAQAGGVKEVVEYKLDYKPANMAWYPVLDREHCTNCRQCENFCLFGVYGKS